MHLQDNRQGELKYNFLDDSITVVSQHLASQVCKRMQKFLKIRKNGQPLAGQRLTRNCFAKNLMRFQ